MPTKPAIILVLSLILTSITQADDYEPLAVRAADFSGLISQSPFNRTLNLSGSLILTGMAEIDNQQVATLLDTETKQTHVVSSTPNREGWKMVEVNPNEDLERVTAKISMGGQVVNIRYAEVKVKPGETRPGGGSSKPEERRDGESSRRRGGPPEDIRNQVGSLSDEQRSKFFSKMREMHEKKPELSQDERNEAARKMLGKFAKKNSK